MTYLTWAEYLALKGNADFDAQAALAKAHRDIDAMTYNRIRRRGFNALTEFQQALVKEAVAEQTQFIAAMRSCSIIRLRRTASTAFP